MACEEIWGHGPCCLLFSDPGGRSEGGRAMTVQQPNRREGMSLRHWFVRLLHGGGGGLPVRPVRPDTNHPPPVDPPAHTIVLRIGLELPTRKFCTWPTWVLSFSATPWSGPLSWIRTPTLWCGPLSWGYGLPHFGVAPRVGDKDSHTSDFVPPLGVGDPLECRGYIAIAPSSGPPRR